MNMNNYEATYLKLIKWTDKRSIGVRTVRSYFTQLKHSQSQRVVHSTMCELAAILPLKYPEQDWVWLKSVARDYAKEINFTKGKRGFSPKQYDSGLQLSAAIAEWPKEVQVKWSALDEMASKAKEQTGAQGILERRRSARCKQVAIKQISVEVRRMYKTALERYFYYFFTQNTDKDWFPDASKARGFANWINASDVTAGIYLENLYRALRYLFPERISELIALKDDAQTVKSMAEPSKDKSIFLLNPAEVFVKARNDFYQALSEPRTIHAMTRARNAAMVCFLCIQPLRAKNFVQLTEQDVEAAMKEFVKSDMKARRPHKVIIPDFLAEVLHSYSQLIKPFLGEVDQLWIANHGDAFKKKGASRAVRNYMKTLVGVAVSIHHFRDMFATYLSEQVEDPKQTKMISLALGHQSEGTTDQFYRNNAQMICDSISLQREIEIFLIAGNE